VRPCNERRCLLARPTAFGLQSGLLSPSSPAARLCFTLAPTEQRATRSGADPHHVARRPLLLVGRRPGRESSAETALVPQTRAVGGVAIFTGELGTSIGTSAIVPEWNMAKVQRVALSNSTSSYNASVTPVLGGVRQAADDRARCGSVVAGGRPSHREDLSHRWQRLLVGAFLEGMPTHASGFRARRATRWRGSGVSVHSQR
jgi:hypothetical protein